VKLEVLDSKGVVVRSVAPTENKAGEHSFAWDGKNSLGEKMPDGTYTLRITAKDSQGSEVTNSTFVDGVVTGVEQSNASTLITVNGVKVVWNGILSISQATTASASNTTSNSNSTGGSTSGTGSTDTSTNTADDKTSSPATA